MKNKFLKLIKLIRNFFLFRKIKKTFKIKMNDFQKLSLETCLRLFTIKIGNHRYGFRQCGATTSMELEALYLSIFHNKFVVVVLSDLSNLHRVRGDILKLIKNANIRCARGGRLIVFKNGGKILLTTELHSIEDLEGQLNVFKILCDNVDIKHSDMLSDRFKNVRVYKTFD